MQLGLLMLELTRQRSAQVYGARPVVQHSRLSGASAKRQKRSGRWLPRVSGGFFDRRDAKVETLRTLALFSGLSRRKLKKVAEIVDSVELPAGYTFVREGDAAREFFVIADGAVEVSQNGHRLAELGSGEWVGEIALVLSSARTATVATRTPTRLFVTTERGFRQLVDGWASIARQIERSLSERTSATVH
jgi:CRP/FNR family transcriptional regulator, cyclic AMP receptor protein